jgi:hypothetical protein
MTTSLVLQHVGELALEGAAHHIEENTVEEEVGLVRLAGGVLVWKILAQHDVARGQVLACKLAIMDEGTFGLISLGGRLKRDCGIEESQGECGVSQVQRDRVSETSKFGKWNHLQEAYSFQTKNTQGSTRHMKKRGRRMS